ncbi:hypothetical protein SS50377_26467 [Spironucleus salmonicida]|uniref:Uncharacterized protein n=1 Tax=Spironucleus salmonicida TaxID=348837 RepID=V6LCD7_9EUKA|nr:hypothetical protein SS50377_26467 [Spironucleus salmonicida]|eukprot:EST41326.1 Hypothetical protein SS50377_19038 [Spironucleus salmonicida]
MGTSDSIEDDGQNTCQEGKPGDQLNDEHALSQVPKQRNSTRLIEKQSQFALLNHRDSLSTLNEKTEYAQSALDIQETDTILTRQLKLQFRENARQKVHDMFK